MPFPIPISTFKIKTTTQRPRPRPPTQTATIQEIPAHTFASFEPISNASFKCLNNGLYPNYQKGCREFYTCWHVGTRWENAMSMSCPHNLLFDNRLKTCNYAHRVNCYANSFIDFEDSMDSYKDKLAILIQVI